MHTIAQFKRWFSNLKVSQKLTLIGVFFLIPDSVMLYLFITGINANIQFARLEKMGNQYQRPLEELLELIPQHRLLAFRAVGGDAVAQSELPRKQDQIDQAFAALQRVDDSLGRALQFTDEGLAKRRREHYRPRLVQQEWQQLRGQVARLNAAEIAERHLHLVTDIRTMITHAGDMSNLILDPDLDSYYLMDTTLLALPQNQDRIAATIAFAATALAKPELDHHDKQQLAVFATLLKEADLNRVLSSMQVALVEDPNFYGVSSTLQQRVPPLLEAYEDATQHFIELTERLHNSDDSGISRDAYLACGEKACDASFQLWRAADEEVDVLLQSRIDHYLGRRTKSLLVTAFALLAATGFVTFITRSISAPLRAHAAELRLANDALEEEVAERKRAEEELRQSEAQLAAAQKIAAVGSWEWSIDNGVMIWSEENYRIHGVEPHAFTPTYQKALEFAPFEDRRLTHLALQAARKEGKPFSFEQRIVRRDGQERILHQRGEPVRDSIGRVVKLVGTAQDVTDRKRSESELEQVHKDLLTASRHAGMAEVATGVLHNVGNVLNSVNVSAMLISERLSKSRVTHLASVSALLRDHAGSLGDFLTSHPKGQKLPAFIQSLAERLGAEQAELLREVEGLTRNIAHIKDIVSVQQGYARGGVSGVLGSHLPVELVQDALHMHGSALERHSVEVAREFSDVPAVLVDKHRVLQILINLIRNAKQAMSGSPFRRLTVRVRATTDAAHIEVTDTGIGIAPEHLERIFAFGFTTRDDGHGFGLHSAALAASEMGGSLSAQSDGPGRGATFTLTLPLDQTASEKSSALCSAL